MSLIKRLLIVDDEPNVRLVFQTALEHSDGRYLIETTGDGEDALRRLSASAADLVLLDLNMPGVGGMEVLRRLRDAGNDVPVVIVTAHGDVPSAVEAMRLGAIDFIAKPLTPDALRSIVAGVLQRHDDRPTFPAGRTSARGETETETESVTPASEFARNFSRAKRALNRRMFEEAEVFLKQALALDSGSAEALNLSGVLHELRGEHDASYRAYRAALAVNRHYEPARHNMTRYYERFSFGRSNVPLDAGAP